MPLTRKTVVWYATCLAFVQVHGTVKGGEGVGSAFTYQGQLKLDAVPVDDTCDFEFTLWTAPDIGADQIGAALTHDGQSGNAPSIEVVHGLFSTSLDFGADVFNGDARWLQISVRCPSDSSGDLTYIALSPRQPLASTPHALHARGITVDDTGDAGLGTQNPLARLDVVADTASSGNNTARFSAPTIGPYTSHIHYGTQGNWYIRSADPEGAVIMQDTGGSVGVGTATPVNPLHVESSRAYPVYAHHTTSNGFPASALYGVCDSSNGRGVEGVASASDGVAVGVLGSSNSGVGSGVRGVAHSAGGTNYGVYGSSNSSAGYDFYAAGAGMNYGSSSSVRWKKHIQSIQEPLEKVARLRGVYFDWDNAHGGHHDIGMIAEEVGAVLPEIVHYEENGVDASGMDYSKISPLLVEAVKALRQEKNDEIAELRAENHALARKLEELELLICEAPQPCGRHPREGGLTKAIGKPSQP